MGNTQIRDNTCTGNDIPFPASIAGKKYTDKYINKISLNCFAVVAA
jgi:hypothetical protein